MSLVIHICHLSCQELASQDSFHIVWALREVICGVWKLEVNRSHSSYLGRWTCWAQHWELKWPAQDRSWTCSSDFPTPGQVQSLARCWHVPDPRQENLNHLSERFGGCWSSQKWICSTLTKAQRVQTYFCSFKVIWQDAWPEVRFEDKRIFWSGMWLFDVWRCAEEIALFFVSWQRRLLSSPFWIKGIREL